MKKVTVNIAVEMEFDDEYPLATRLEDCHTIGGRSACDAWYSLADRIMEWVPRNRWLLDGEPRLSGIAGGKVLMGDVTSVEIHAGNGGELGYALVSNDDEQSGVFIRVVSVDSLDARHIEVS